jgi:hypothetical protein
MVERYSSGENTGSSSGGSGGDRGGDDETKDELQEQGLHRLAQARQKKALWGLDMKECYYFSAPHRQREIYSQTKPWNTRRQDAPELNTSLAFDVVGEFVTEVIQTFLPEWQPWVAAGAGMFVPPDSWDQVKEVAQRNDEQIFGAITASNFYSELPKSYDPDLAIGTCGLWVDQPHMALPIEASAIPLRELECNLGPNGMIDDRFAVRWTTYRYIDQLLPGVKFPDSVGKLMQDKRDVHCKVTRGFWREWDEPSEVYQYVAFVDDVLVDWRDIRGEGSCPLIVTRFNPSADWVWGIGPLFKTLTDFRQDDELAAMKMLGVARNTNPPMGYPDDSFTNIAQGLEEGMGYPMRSGTKQDQIVPLFPKVDMQPAIFATQDMEKRIRRLFFVDYPEQSGDTPPTAAQWMDQLARAQRRIGTPGMSFWREGPMQYYLRYKYLLERNGAIQPLQIDGRNISARPMNPAQRAAEQQEIAMAAQFIQLAGQAWPEEFKAFVDGQLSMKALADKMRVTLIKFRDPQQVQGALKTIQPLLQQHFAPGAPQQPGQEQPQGPMQ